MAATQTITYGTLTLPYTTLTDKATLVKNVAGTVVATEYSITVRGFVIAAGADDTVYESLTTVRQAFAKPRQRLTISWTPSGGSAEKMYDFAPASLETADPASDWGPMVESYGFQQFTGGLATQYEVTFVARTREGWNAGGNRLPDLNPITEVTRAYNFALDADGLTTRTVSGRISILRNAITADANKPRGLDFYRDIVVPPLPDGFKRESFTFSPDETGLTATYSVTDVEVGYTLPKPITQGQATFSVSFRILGGMVNCSLSGWYSAPKTVPKATLVAMAIALRDSKTALGGGGTVIPDKNDLTAEVYSNKVSFSFSWRMPYLVNVGTVKVPVINLLVTPPPGSTGQSANPGLYGTAGLTSHVMRNPYNAYETTTDQLRGELARKTGAAASSMGLPGDKQAEQNLPNPAMDVSAIHRLTPILEFVHVRSYELRSYLVVFGPKQEGKAPIIQQTRPPQMFVIDSGLIRFAAKSAADAPPIPAPPRGTVSESFFDISAPEPISGGELNQYRLKFRRLLISTAVLEGDDLKTIGAEFPADIRRGSAKAEKYDKTAAGFYTGGV